MAVEALPDAHFGEPARALLHGDGATGQQFADDARRDRYQLVLIGVERDQAETKCEPDHPIARHRAYSPAITPHHAAANKDKESEAERDIAERGAVEAADHALIVGNQQNGGERQDEEGEPGRHAFSLSLARGARCAPGAPP